MGWKEFAEYVNPQYGELEQKRREEKEVSAPLPAALAQWVSKQLGAPPGVIRTYGDLERVKGAGIKPSGPPDPYTLGKDQIRFGGTGDEIARGVKSEPPAMPMYRQTPEGGTVAMDVPQSQVADYAFDKGEDWNMGKYTAPHQAPAPRKIGETRKFEKGGETITQEWNGTAWQELGKGPRWQEASSRKIGEIRKYEKGGNTITEEWTGKDWQELGAGPRWQEAKEDKDPALITEIKQIKAAHPEISDQEASDVATGVSKIMPDPVSGNLYLVNSITKTQRLLTPVEEGPKPPSPREAQKTGEKTIYGDYSDKGTGPWSAVLSGASILSGMFGGPVATETIQARQFIQSAQNDLIRALSINPRFPVGEINRLQKEINISPTLFDNPKQFRARAVAVDRYLRKRLEKERKASDDRYLPVAQRQAARASANDIANFLDLLGVPSAVTTDEDYNAIPTGQKYIDPDGNIRTKK